MNKRLVLLLISLTILVVAAVVVRLKGIPALVKMRFTVNSVGFWPVAV